MLAVPFPFHMHAHTGLPKCKLESQLVRSPSRIDSFILPPSSKVFWGSAPLPLFDFGQVLRSRLDWDRSLLLTNDRSTSRCQSTLIASKCDRLNTSTLLLAFLVSPGVFFVLAMIGIVDCTFHHLPVAGLRPVPFDCSMHKKCFVHGTAVLLPSGRDGTEWKHRRFFGCYCSQSLTTTVGRFLIASFY